MSERLSREAVDRLRRYPRSRLLDHEADIAALLADWERLRGLIVEMDGAVEDALIVPVPPGARILFLASRAPTFFAEARAIRDEQEPAARIGQALIGPATRAGEALGRFLAPEEPRFETNVMGGRATPLRVWVDGVGFVRG